MLRLSNKLLTGILLAALAAACGAALSCRRPSQGDTAPQSTSVASATASGNQASAPATPSVRLYVTSTLAGALEPCGCRKDMLGGVDHAAALIDAGKSEAPHALVVGAGPLFFLNPELSEDKRQQDVWKANSIAQAMADLELAGWAPGVNDFASGTQELASLVGTSGAKLLAANLQAPQLPLTAQHVVDVGGYKVGLVGVSLLPKERLPEAVALSDAKQALVQAETALRSSGAQVLVALVAAQRGEALRLAEAVSGYHLMVVGKPLDSGEGNDAPTPPVSVGQTLVVQGPNHLQGLALVDLFVRDTDPGKTLKFADGSGIAAEEEKLSLQQRIEELKQRLVQWRQGGASPQDLKAREADLARLEQELEYLARPKAPPAESFFRYELRLVREALGSDPRVTERMRQYYKQVNEHNRVALAHKKPLPAAADQSSYVGVQMCKSCHEPAFQFWQGTRHAGAYETLAKDFKEYNLDCVGCHVTGYERPGGSTVTFVENLQNVQCESCHGAGSIHSRTKTRESIRRTPLHDECKKCHHPPHVLDDWDVFEAWKHVIGPGHGLPLPGPAGSTK